MMQHNRERAILGWWRNLRPDPSTGAKGDRAGAAKLRHADTVLEAAMQPATLGLCRALAATPGELPAIALIAAILAELREDDRGQTIARALGGPDPNSRLCSALRFQRLIEAPGPDAQLTAFRRTLALLKHRGHAADLAASLLDWNDPRRRDARMQRWLYDYYHTDNPARTPREEATP